MMPSSSLLLAIAAIAATATATAVASTSHPVERDVSLDFALNLNASLQQLSLNTSLKASIALDPYAPYPTTCPDIPLVRPANNISHDEAAYIASRKPNADKSLGAWLATQGRFSNTSQPVVAFASSGGGLRALLTTAGVIQAFDARDSNLSTRGLYQGLTYESGLSGGAWFLSSLAGNNWPTVSELLKSHWLIGFFNGLVLPANLLTSGLEYVPIVVDVLAKAAAGFVPTIIDLYGRILSYQFLGGQDGGVLTTLSSLKTLSNFTTFKVPYPIMTTTAITQAYQEGCFPALNATIYEFHPYEYGSWDTGVSAFARTEYMGTNMNNGAPANAGQCTANYDNIGYIFGTSSDIFNYLCEPLEPLVQNILLIREALQAVVALTHVPTFLDFFGVYPNPFYNYSGSPFVQHEQLLSMADGGDTNQNIPIWPFIQPSRHVDVLIANDVSNDEGGFPTGLDPRQTFEQAQANGLSRMPFIPEASIFVEQGLNKRATFFGCNQTDTVFIVYLPNVAYTFPSNTSTFELEYNFQRTKGMINNGNHIATQNGTADWPFCLACAIKNQDGPALPSGCNQCFAKYCYYKP